jgi:hypothetical protein
MLKTVSSIVNAIGALNYKGTWNASTNTPALASGVGIKGDYYVVSVAGTTSLDGISNWGVGDWVTFNGSVWQRVEGGADLNGVNLSYTGTLTGGTGIIDIGSGQFYKAADGSIGLGTQVPGAQPNAATISLLASGTNTAFSGNIRITHGALAPSGAGFMDFWYNTANIGSIGQNGTTGVTYSTTSDYRLKQDIAPMSGAIQKISALKPVTYKWKADNSDGQGFIAHELQEVFPDAVVGEKDAVEGLVDEDGNINYRPKYQGIDTSFLVATLVAAVQELNAELQAVKQELATIKGA